MLYNAKQKLVEAFQKGVMPKPVALKEQTESHTLSPPSCMIKHVEHDVHLIFHRFFNRAHDAANVYDFRSSNTTCDSPNTPPRPFSHNLHLPLLLEASQRL